MSCIGETGTPSFLKKRRKLSLKSDPLCSVVNILNWDWEAERILKLDEKEEKGVNLAEGDRTLSPS